MPEEFGAPVTQGGSGFRFLAFGEHPVRETAKKLPFICDPVRVTHDDVEDATRTILTDLKD